MDSDGLVLGIFVGVISSLIAAVIIRFFPLLFARIGKFIIDLLSKSNKHFSNYIIKKTASLDFPLFGYKRAYPFLGGLILAVGIIFVQELHEEEQEIYEVKEFLIENNLEINPTSFVDARNLLNRDFEINRVEAGFNIMFVGWVYYAVIVSFSALCLAAVFRVIIASLVRSSIETFKNSSLILRPKIGEVEYHKLISEWLSMKTIEDFNRIQDRLQTLNQVN